MIVFIYQFGLESLAKPSHVTIFDFIDLLWFSIIYATNKNSTDYDWGSLAKIVYIKIFGSP
jgi:hypothetical protein